MKAKVNERGRKSWLITVCKGEAVVFDLNGWMAALILQKLQVAGYCSMANKLSDRYIFGYFGWDTDTLAEGIGSACCCEYNSWQDLANGLSASVESIKRWFEQADPACYRFLNVLEAEQAKKQGN